MEQLEFFQFRHWRRDGTEFQAVLKVDGFYFYGWGRTIATAEQDARQKLAMSV